ncbi:MAG: ABC transporter ATP-binding protein, partial [Clostridia bacterium]
MTSVSQSGLDKIRRDMFAKMQKLPLSYFDTNAHGDIMSKYTNDIDTLRELLSQVLPQVFSTIVTLALVFSAMVATSWELTILVIASVVLMLVVIAYLAKKSGKYYLAQQNSLGEVNGYIEEMMNGQKVVKVFCHEEKTKEGFDELNQKLAKNSAAANGIASIFMPVMNNLGNVQYVLIALVGGMLAINGVGGGHITLGVIAAFLQLSKSFTNPIIQVAQQLNFLVMAFAGADRIFEMMDEKPEQDDGYVTLVNAKVVDGQLVETNERTEMWAWKHPHKDTNTVTYTALNGDVVFEDVDFGYTPQKLVLKNLNLHADAGQKIAFVGSTGAGKTTITNLINRFYEISNGKIRYDGINISKIKKDDLRRSLGIVLQETNLFSG